MPFVRKPSRSDDHLSNYWNALVRNAPAEELARLAHLVEPSDIAAIERAHAAHERYEPDPMFARRLEQTIMDTALSPIAGTIPQPHASSPSRNGSRDPGPVSHRRALTPPQRTGWPLRPAVAIALVILLVLASAGGAWWAYTNTGQDEPHRLLAPIVATPTPDASPGWSHFKGDSARRGEADAGPVEQPVELWRHQAAGPCIAVPAVVQNAVYAPCTDDTLYALDAATGEVLWQFTAEPPVSFVDGTAVSGDLLYAIGGDETLYAVDIATGEERWRFDSAPVALTPAVEGDMAVTGTPDGFLIGIDTATGEEQWRSQVTEGGMARVPALLHGVAFAGSDTGDFTAIDVATGELLWTVDTGENPTGTAVVAEGIAYIGSSADAQTGTLAAYDAATGDLLWQRDEPMHSPSVSNGVGYSGSSDGTVYAFDTATGEELWRIQVGGVARPLAVAGDILYVPSDGDRAVYAIDIATGEELWHVEVAGNIDSQAAVADGRIVVATMSGTIHAFGEGDAGPAAASPAATPMADQNATPVHSQDATPPATSGIVVEALWQSTGGPDLLNVPTGMAIAPDGTLWAVDSDNDRFQLFSPEGEYLETWGEAGDGEGEFDFSPSPDYEGDSVGGIAFDAEGNFYVGDSANQRIQKFDATRNFLMSWGVEGEGEGQFLLPYWPVVAPDGNVYVGDGMRSDVQVFTPEGEFLYQLTGPGTGDHQLRGLGSLTIADDGTVYVTDVVAGTIKTFGPDGTFIDSWGSYGIDEGEFRGPSSVAIDAAGNLYVTDTENGRVQVFGPAREFLGLWSHADASGTPFMLPLAVIIDEAGGVYVTDLGADTVQKFAVTVPATPGATPAD